MEEDHQDGGKHWHVFLLFQNSFQTRDHQVFNLTTQGGATLYPNIRVSKCTKDDLKRIWSYLNKTEAKVIGTWEYQEAKYAHLKFHLLSGFSHIALDLVVPR